MPEPIQSTLVRSVWMGVLAKARPDELEALWASADLQVDRSFLRAPEIGTVMARGRTGGVGNAFNLGEVSVVRCSIRLATGEVGHSYVMGRDKSHAETAAICDALMQGPHADTVEAQILSPLRASHKKRHGQLAAKADKTRVEFFTMVRGE